MFVTVYLSTIVAGLLVADHYPAQWNQFTNMSAWRTPGKGRFIFTWKA